MVAVGESSTAAILFDSGPLKPEDKFNITSNISADVSAVGSIYGFKRKQLVKLVRIPLQKHSEMKHKNPSRLLNRKPLKGFLLFHGSVNQKNM